MKRRLPAAITAVIALFVQASLGHAADEAVDSSEGAYVSLGDLEQEQGDLTGDSGEPEPRVQGSVPVASIGTESQSPTVQGSVPVALVGTESQSLTVQGSIPGALVGTESEPSPVTRAIPGALAGKESQPSTVTRAIPDALVGKESQPSTVTRRVTDGLAEAGKATLSALAGTVVAGEDTATATASVEPFTVDPEEAASTDGQQADLEGFFSSDLLRTASPLEIPPRRPGQRISKIEKHPRVNTRPRVPAQPISLAASEEDRLSGSSPLDDVLHPHPLPLAMAQPEPVADSPLRILPDGDGAAGCDDLTCADHCLENCPLCCSPAQHLTSVYAEALYLRPRNAEVVYAVPADGPVAGGQPVPVQVGSLGVLDPDYDMGARLGLRVALDTVSSFDIRYTFFTSHTADEIAAQPSLFLRSQLTHPSTPSASVDALAGSGTLDIDFNTLDVTYRSLKSGCDLLSWNYVVGARYARLEQQFATQFIKNGTESITSDIDFDGGGIRIGLEGLRHSCRNRLHLYANGYANLLAGRFRARHFQGHSFDTEVVNVEWEAGRVVPIVDLECGVGWTSADCRLRMTAGYQVSAWFNTVRTQDFANAVQTNEYLHLNETMTFDGLQARVEIRF